MCGLVCGSVCAVVLSLTFAREMLHTPKSKDMCARQNTQKQIVIKLKI